MSYCVFRNRARYDNAALAPRAYKKRRHDVVADFPTSRGVLSAFAREDEAAKATTFAKTIASCSHDSMQLVIHSGGKHMDQLLVRHQGSFLAPPAAGAEELGFSLSIGRGEAILSTALAGSSNWGETAHLLSVTRSEVIHTKTTRVGDHLPQHDHPCYSAKVASSAVGSNMRDSVVLEPVQKWQLPDEIVCVDTAKSPSLSLAVILAHSGRLYTWNPLEGVAHFAKTRQLSQPASPAEKRTALQVEFSLHPSVVHVVSSQYAYSIDLRQGGGGGSQERPWQSSNPASSRFSSICQHGTNAELVFLACNAGFVSLYDIRFPKKFVSRCSVPFSHESLAFTHLETGGGMLLGYGSRANQLALHVIGNDGNSPAAGAGRFLGAQNASSDSSFSWSTTAVPVIDHATPSVFLWGACLLRHQSNVVLLQQSSIGDVYAQRLATSKGAPVAAERKPLRSDVLGPLALEKSVVFPPDYHQTKTAGYPFPASAFLPVVSRDNLRASRVLSTRLENSSSRREPAVPLMSTGKKRMKT